MLIDETFNAEDNDCWLNNNHRNIINSRILNSNLNLKSYKNHIKLNVARKKNDEQIRRRNRSTLATHFVINFVLLKKKKTF